MKLRISIIFFILYLVSCILHPSAYADGEAGGAAPFLYFGVGSRALAMGGAYIAVSDDATSAYWNPAGMIHLRQNELQTMHTEMWAEVKYDYVGYVHILGARGKGQGAGKENPVSGIKHPASKALGLSFIRLDAGTQEARDKFKNITGYFSCNDTAVILSYAQRLNTRYRIQDTGLSIGANLKYVRQKIAEESGKGYDLDIGFLYKPLLGTRDKGQGARKNEPLTLTLVFQNILQSKIDWSTGAKDPLPFIFKVGTAYKLTEDRLILAFDTAKIQHEPSWKFHFGGEYKVIGAGDRIQDTGDRIQDTGDKIQDTGYRIQDTSKEQSSAKDKASVSIRAGSDDKNFTAGIGVGYENYSFDYAYVTHERLGNKHRISVGMRF